MSMLPTTINFFVMIGAAVASWLFGAMYYGTLGKQWVAAQDSTMEEFRAKQVARVGKLSAQAPFIFAFIAQLIIAYVLYGMMKDRKSTRLNSSHTSVSRMPSSA